MRAAQPSTQAFSSRSHDLARNFATSPNGIPRERVLRGSFGDVTTVRTKSSRGERLGAEGGALVWFRNLSGG